MHVSRLVADGMPKLARGQYDAVACLRWDNARLRTSVARKATDGGDGKPRNLMDERARLTAAQADTAQMDRDERQGKLVPLELYEQKLTNWAITTKQLVLGVAPRLAAKLEGLPRVKLRAVLEETLKGCLTDVATGRVVPAADVPPKPARKPRKRR